MSIEIGSYLKNAREALGLTLEQLQEMTKIQKSFITAIEKGEFQKLPSPFYVRTYLRSYANCVKVEPHHILRQYRKEEQAERGLTGAHKIVDESMILEHKLVVDNKNRVTTNMALTIAQPSELKVTSEPLHTDRALKVIARRNAGYQRVTSNHKSFSKTNSSLDDRSERWLDADQSVSTWGSSEPPLASHTPQLSRQATSRLSALQQSNSMLTLNEPMVLPKRLRNLKRAKVANGSLFYLGMWLSILVGVCGAIYLLSKLKYF